MDRLAVMEQFLAVAEAGSFSAAARRLNVGQPSISKAVAQLEAYLGVRLFQRSTRSLTLTEAGRRYRDGAERAIAAAAAAEFAAKEDGGWPGARRGPDLPCPAASRATSPGIL